MARTLSESTAPSRRGGIWCSAAVASWSTRPDSTGRRRCHEDCSRQCAHKPACSLDSQTSLHPHMHCFKTERPMPLSAQEAFTNLQLGGCDNTATCFSICNIFMWRSLYFRFSTRLDKSTPQEIRLASQSHRDDNETKQYREKNNDVFRVYRWPLEFQSSKLVSISTAAAAVAVDSASKDSEGKEGSTRCH